MKSNFMTTNLTSLLFSPADALINRMSFYKKFTLLGVMTLIALSVALFSLYTQMNGVISNSRRALEGLALIQPLTQSVQTIQQHRGLSSGALLSRASDFGAMRMMKEQVAAVDFNRLEARLPDSVRQLESWKSIASEWRDIKTHGMLWPQPKNFTKHTQLINDMLLFVSIIADNYGLTVDASLDTYYLTHTSTNDLLRALEHLGQMRTYGIAILAANKISEQQKSDMVELISLLKYVLKPLKVNMGKVAYYNPSLQKALSETYSNIDQSSHQVIAASILTF